MIGGLALSRRTKLGGGVAGPFTPASISGLQAWFDAPFLAQADASAVSSLTDRSGNARHAAQATAGNQPTYRTAVQNGLDVVRFSTDDYLDTSTFARAQPQTVLMVVKFNATTGNQTVHDAVSAVNTGRLFRDPTFNSGNLTAYAGASVVTSFTPVNGIFGIVAIIYSGAASKMWANGGAAATGTTGAAQGTGVRLGASGAAAGNFGNFDLGEWFVYSTALTLSDVDLAGNYLGTRWGITWTTAT